MKELTILQEQYIEFIEEKINKYSYGDIYDFVNGKELTDEQFEEITDMKLEVKRGL